MTSKVLEKSIVATKEAARSLCDALELLKKDAPDHNRRAFYLDGIIKRYEVLFEYTWKMLKAAADFQGAEAPGPRPAIQEAYRFGWIDDPDFWALALDARNGSVHDYFGITRDEYLDIIKKFSVEVENVIKKLDEPEFVKRPKNIAVKAGRKKGR